LKLTELRRLFLKLRDRVAEDSLCYQVSRGQSTDKERHGLGYITELTGKCQKMRY